MNIATDTWKAIGMDTIDYNTDNSFSIANRRIVMPSNGTLIVMARCSFYNNSNGDRGIGFEVNNELSSSTCIVNRSCESTKTNISTQSIIHVSKGDTVTVQVYQNSGDHLEVEAIWIRCALIRD